MALQIKKATDVGFIGTKDLVIGKPNYFTTHEEGISYVIVDTNFKDKFITLTESQARSLVKDFPSELEDK